MAVQRDKVTHGLLEIIRLLIQVLLISLGVRASMPAVPAVDLQPLKAEIREQFADVRAEVRDIDRRVAAVERAL